TRCYRDWSSDVCSSDLTISLTSREPSYVTPEIKSTLRRRNLLMRAGRVEEASALGVKIRALISKRNTAYLKQDGEKFDSKDMWEKVRQLSNRSQPQLHSSITATELNDHFSSISHDTHYA